MSLLKNAGAIRQSVQEMQARLSEARFVGEAGGGQVRATVDGKGELVQMRIDPVLIRAGDVELIEELTCAAVRDAITRSREAVQREMQELTGGMNLPGLTDLLGGSKE